MRRPDVRIGLLCGARGRCGGSAPAVFHGPEGGDGQEVAGDVEVSDAWVCGGDEGGLEGLTEAIDIYDGGFVDQGDGGGALVGDVVDCVEVLIGEEGEEDGDEDGGDEVGALSEGGEGQEAADDDDVEGPVPL